ncbi:LmeA family phospholipid-binding protein [Streptomyces sp. NPDC014684]|uniref:LmeA family phospholipid-binding protein n=1 Tax=Streptomyces sp. NPDC014684 TaxID=3364880 RepID=UPI0036F5F4B9
MQLTRNRRLTAAIVALALPLTLAAGTNAYLEHQAEHRIAAAAAARLHPAENVTATIDDPFAGLAALRGKLGSVTIHADDVRRQGLTLALQAHLNHVTTKGHTAGGTADVTIPYKELGQRLSPANSPTLAPGTDNQELTLTTTAGNLGIPVTIHTRLTTTSRQLTLTPTVITLLGRDIPAQDLARLPAASTLDAKIQPRTVTLKQLPHNVTLTSAGAVREGLVLHLDLAPTTRT